jgi:hypothetical protein
MTAQTVAEPATKPLAVWVPRLLWLIAGVHLVYGVLVDTVWLEMMRDGLFGTASVDDDLLAAERMFALYFEVSGIAMLALAHLAQDRVRTTGQLPLYFGLYLLAAGAVLCAVEPATGAWSIVAAAIFAIYVSLRPGPAPRD